MSINQSRKSNSSASESSDEQISLDTVFNSVADHYKQDLREFFTRANFYLAVQTALLSAIGFREAPNSKVDWAIMFFIALTGAVLACVWGVISIGAVRWIRLWREEVLRLSNEFSLTKSYFNVENETKDHRYWSPEELTKFVPWFFVTLWILLPITMWIVSQGLS